MTRAGANAGSDRESGAVWQLSRRQHGMVTRRQLLQLGFSERAIEHRLARGRLHEFDRGVYAVGRPESSTRARWMAAVLVCGPRAALSHRSAAALWGIDERRDGPVDVTVRGRFESRRAWVRARSRPRLPAEDVVERDGIPVTGAVRTLLDRASELLPPSLKRRAPAFERRQRRLERLISEADKLGLVDAGALLEELEGRRGEPGVRPLRELLERDCFLLSDSDLEIFFRRIVRAGRLPMPLSKQIVDGHEVDFYWPELRLVVEADGLKYHRVASTQTRDLQRDHAHVVSGLTTLRFNHYQVARKPGYVRGVLRATIRRLETARRLETGPAGG